MVVSTEILGAFKAITQLGLSLTWLLVIVAFIVWLIIEFKRGFIFRLPLVYHPTSKAVLAWDIIITVIVLIPLIIGFISPPNSQEAMGFGMTRVAHWAQNRSLAHFATQNEGLNSTPPGIGIGLLNMYVLSGSDRWCNVITWFAYLGCIQAVIAIARMFGARAEGTRLAAVFGATLPIALALASGCLDDLPATLWVVSYVMMVFFFIEDNNYKFNITLAAFAAGLAFLTKPVTVLLLIPFGLYLYAQQIGRIKFTKILKRLLMTTIVIFGLVSGFVFRNFATYGTAIQVPAYFETLNEEYSLRVTVSNFLRNLSLNADLPFPRAETWLQGQIVRFHARIGMDVNDPKITFGGAYAIPRMNTSEMTSGNPLHTLLMAGVILTAVITLIKRKDVSSREVVIFTGLLLTSYVLFNVFLKWQPSGSRWQLPYFFLFAPIIGLTLDRFDRAKFPVGSIISVLLVLAAFPWLFSVKERPVIPMPEFTQNRSILRSTRAEMYFNTQPEDYDLYITTGKYILGQATNQRVGLDVDGPILEYPLWAVMKTIEKRTLIAYLNAKGESSKYLNREFSPTAIFSTHCDQNAQGADFVLLKKSNTGACFFIEK